MEQCQRLPVVDPPQVLQQGIELIGKLIGGMNVIVGGQPLQISHPKRKAFTDAFVRFMETQRYEGAKMRITFSSFSRRSLAASMPLSMGIMMSIYTMWNGEYFSKNVIGS